MLKEKLLLRNMLNQVYNLPEMKLSSVYFFKKAPRVACILCYAFYFNRVKSWPSMWRLRKVKDIVTLGKMLH